VKLAAEHRSQSWLAAILAVGLALVLICGVLALAACSSFESLPTVVPTLAFPTSHSSAADVLPEATPVSLPTARPALVLSYDLDPATGQMIPVDGFSASVTESSDQLWVVTDNAFVEYHRQGSDEMVAHKIITYTYDHLGRRVGWTIDWPQGPTATQRLSFLYEGLVAVGERLEIGDVVTTTYYAWATRDRNTTLDDLAVGVDAPITDVTRFDARCEAAAELDCVTMIAKIVVSEASIGNEDEQRAVAWTFRNRLDRGLALLSYAMGIVPDREWYFELAREVLTAPVEADVTKGATHFFSPRSMPLQGQEDRCKPNGIYDCDGGLVFVEGLDGPAYAPYWHLLYEWLPVTGIRKTHFLFYRIPPIVPRVSQ
jgi:hypothetical protein